MILDGLLVFVGLAILTLGAEALVRGASGIAVLARVSPGVVALTIVAAGTSMPELVVSLLSALRGSPGLALGNVVGSNVFNIGAVVGLAALVRPLRIEGSSVRLEWPVMMLSACQLHLLCRDGLVDRLEGGFLLGALVVFTVYVTAVVRPVAASSGEEATEQDLATASLGRVGGAAAALNVAAVVLGAGLLAAGSTALVRGAVGIAEGLGVSDTTIGLTIVAAGTSTPELVTSLVAVRRGQDDVAVGNAIGSNIFNALGIVGATSLVRPLTVPPRIVERDDWWMLAATLMLLPLMRSQMTVSRREGALLLAGFCAYLALLVQAGG